MASQKTTIGAYSTFEGSPASNGELQLICGMLLLVICMIGIH